jgi:hypothetical protein
MSPRYDLFRLDEAGPLWFGTAETMWDAHAKAAQLTDCPECRISFGLAEAAFP